MPLQEKRKKTLYFKTMGTRKVKLPFYLAGSNLDAIIKEKLVNRLEGKCSNEGYIKPYSVQITSHSSGILEGADIIFDVVFECRACAPVQGMVIKCNIQNITKAGIRATIKGEHSPVIIFVARDHQYNNEYFNQRKEGEEIKVRVIGQRYELNDTYISIIGTLVEPKTKKRKNT